MLCCGFSRGFGLQLNHSGGLSLKKFKNVVRCLFICRKLCYFYFGTKIFHKDLVVAKTCSIHIEQVTFHGELSKRGETSSRK